MAFVRKRRRFLAAILVAVQSLGNLLVLAVVVAPAAAARLIADRMGALMAMAGGLAVGAGVGGLYASYYLGTAAGASIAAVAVVIYLAAAGGRAVVSARA